MAGGRLTRDADQEESQLPGFPAFGLGLGFLPLARLEQCSEIAQVSFAVLTATASFQPPPLAGPTLRHPHPQMKELNLHPLPPPAWGSFQVSCK